MPEEYGWSTGKNALFSSRGRFDPWTLAWSAEALPQDILSLTPLDALQRLAEAGSIRRVPVGVIGPKEATPEELAVAERLGAMIAKHGLQLLCGGKNGVMEAVCKGCLEAGGLPIGLLPDEEWSYANPYVAIPIATGIGPARNAIIARAAQALVAIGGGYGTLSEMAFGLHFNRPVLTLGAVPHVDGAIACADVDEAMSRLARHVLGESAGY